MGSGAGQAGRGTGPLGGPGAGFAGAGGPAPGPNLATLADQVRGYLQGMMGGGQGADLANFGSVLQNLGMDQDGVQPGTQGAVRQAVGAMAPEQQIDLFRGAAQMRSGPLRNLFGRLASTMAAPSFARAFANGSMALDQVSNFAGQLRPLSPNPERWAGQLVDALRREGVSEEQLAQMVDMLTWEDQPTAVKLDKILDGQRIFEMPVDKVLAFLRELLEAGRNQDFLKVMRHFAGGLVVPAVARRAAVAQAFETIADWADIPGMPSVLLDDLTRLLSAAFGREKDPDVHQWLAKGVEHILWYSVERGDPGRAHDLFLELQDAATEVAVPAAWKTQALADLLKRLGSPERLDLVLEQLYLMDRQIAAVQLHPYLRLLGGNAANHLVEKLANDTDRMHRALLLDALKACGMVALEPLLESLKSDAWFVVRNSLLVLGEVAGPEHAPALAPCLNHPDARVVGSAIRALGRMGGRAAETALVPMLAHKDSTIQMETLFILNELKSKVAVPALIELVRGSGKVRRPLEQDRVREKAVEVLGRTEAPSAPLVLGELLNRRRGFFRDSKEPLPMRLAALRALAAMESREAQETLRKAMEEEPAGPERDALLAALAEVQASRARG
jgi:hypothetical protein